MANIDVEITDNSDVFRNAAQEVVATALEAIGLQAEGYAKLICPVDTGRLRNSITHAVEETENAAYVGTNVEYAAYVEMGTSRMRARPYLKPAVMDHVPEYKAIAESILKNADS